MTDRNDLVPAQEKLEWVTPKISLMGAADTYGKVARRINFEYIQNGITYTPIAAKAGPS